MCAIPGGDVYFYLFFRYKVNGDEETEVQNERMFVIQIADGQIQKGNRGKRNKGAVNKSRSCRDYRHLYTI